MHADSRRPEQAHVCYLLIIESATFLLVQSLLEMGFAELVEELLKACPKKRQTMLFSATMNKQVRWTLCSQPYTTE